MKAMAVMQGGQPVAPHVEIIEIDPPTPASGEVLIRTEASALNHLDLWVGMGIPGIERPWPRVTGSDGVGTVDAVGEGVDEAWIGRRVVMNAAVQVEQGRHPDVDPAGEELSAEECHRNRSEDESACGGTVDEPGPVIRARSADADRSKREGAGADGFDAIEVEQQHESGDEDETAARADDGAVGGHDDAEADEGHDRQEIHERLPRNARF